MTNRSIHSNMGAIFFLMFASLSSLVVSSANAATVKNLQPTVTCQNQGDYSLDHLTISRSNSKLKISFVPRQGEVLTATQRIQFIPVNDVNKATKNDRRLPFFCQYDRSLPFNAYKTESIKTVNLCSGKTDKRRCSWAIDTEVTKLRDEANGVAIIGLDKNNQRTFFVYRAFGERLSGTFTGRLWSMACQASAVGLPASTSAFLFSKSFLDILSVVDQRNTGAGSVAGTASQFLDVFAVSMGVDPNTGTVDSSGRTRVKALTDTAARILATELLSKITTSTGDKLFGDKLKITKVKRVKRGVYDVSVQGIVPFQSAAQFGASLATFSENVKENKNICKVWKGGS